LVDYQPIDEFDESEYITLNLTSLDDDTSYNYTLCLTGTEFTDSCYAQQNFTTLAYTPPFINVITAFNITNHEATLGATVLYNDYENITLEYYFDGSRVSVDSFNQVDEFDTSEYYTDEQTGLDYFTYYNYSLDITYINPHILAGASDSNWNSGYRINNSGTSEVYQIAFRNGRIGAAGWEDQNLREISSGQECVELCNKWFGDPTLNSETASLWLWNATLGDYEFQIVDTLSSIGTMTCWYIPYGAAPWEECYVGTEDSFIWYNAGSDGNQYAQVMNQSTPIPVVITGTTYDFRTLTAYIPYITISNAIDIVSTTATLTGTHYTYDYPSSVPFFRLDGEDQYPKTNITKGYGETNTFTLDLTGLETNTTYNYTFCVGYDTGWSLLVCDSTKEFTTGFEPSLTFGIPNPLGQNDVTLHWTFDWNEATNVSWRFSDAGGDWIPSHDGVTYDYEVDGLIAETTYYYYLQYRFDTLGTTHYVNTSLQSYTTDYANQFDSIWETMFQGSSFAKILLGFVVMFGIIFLGVGAFGKYNIQISMVAVLIFTIVGAVLSTLMNLFTFFHLLLIIIGSVLLMVMKSMFFGGGDR